jgi:hypothetical protein
MSLPFEQLPKESIKAFAAFSLYLGLGPQRSLDAVAHKLAKSQQLMKRWSAKYDWPARVQAHATHFALIEREAAEAMVRGKAAQWVKRQEEQRDEEWKVRDELLEIGREAIARWKRDARRCGSLEGIARLLELASKLGRLSSGMATDKTEIVGEVDLTFRTEVEAAIKKVYGNVIDVETVEQRQIEGGKL